MTLEKGVVGDLQRLGMTMSLCLNHLVHLDYIVVNTCDESYGLDLNQFGFRFGCALKHVVAPKSSEDGKWHITRNS